MRRLILSLFTAGVVSVAVLAQTPARIPGLVATGSDGERTVNFVTPTPNFTLAAADSIHPRLKPAFTVIWKGNLSILRAGKYTFHSTGTVRVDGREAGSGPVALEAGERNLEVEFKRSAGPVRLQLEWEAEFFKREPVPASVLSHGPQSAPTAAASERGRQLLEDFNCAGCHRPSGLAVAGRTAPDLSQVGDRASAAWMFQWLENPRHFRGDAAMPALLKTAQERADVTAYLASLKSATPPAPLKADANRAAKGEELFRSLGCAGCHTATQASLAGMGSKSPAAALARYLVSPLEVDPSGRMPDLSLSHGEAEALALHLVNSKRPEFEAAPPAGDAVRGRQLVAASGCVNCHAIRDSQGVVASTLLAPALEKLAPGKGCVAEAPAASGPRYGLTAAEREALNAWLENPDRSPAPVQEFHRLSAQLNCRGCHELFTPAAQGFAMNQAPPPLTDAGNKLRESWLSAVLLSHKRVRPWKDVRMPHYGDAVRPLVRLFFAQAGAEPGEGLLPAKPTKEQAEAAVKILGVGEGGLACVNCHDYRGQKSAGEMRGPDLTEMTARIRADWMRRWLREPARLQPGTAMPAFFSDMPAAKADAMIDTVVQALASGIDMPEPPGVGESALNYTLTVGDTPVLLRTFLPNSHPRAIAVGLPGGQSYCFDAQYCLLRYAWSGGFLDAKPAWGGRGGEVALPLGTVWYSPAAVHPLRLGDPNTQTQFRFQGYELEKGLPVFLYEAGGTTVRERIRATADHKGIIREFEIGPVSGGVWLAAPEAPRVKATSSAGAFSNGLIKLTPTSAGLKVSLTLEPQ